MVSGDIDVNEFHTSTTGTVQWIVMEGDLDAKRPRLQFGKDRAHVGFSQMDQMRSTRVGLRIQTIITEHVKTLFRDVYDKFLDKFMSVLFNDHFLVVFMPLIPPGDIGAIIIGDAGLSHGGTANVAGDVIRDLHGGVKVCFGRCIDIETFWVTAIEKRSQPIKIRVGEDRWVQCRTHIVKQSGLPAFSKHHKGKMMDILPWSFLTDCAFRKKHMDVRIPLQIPSKRVKSDDHPGGKMFFVIL